MLLLGHSRLLTGQEEKWYLAADLTVLLFPYLVFICLAAAFNATLNVFQRFTEPALSPIWLNLSMILTLGGAGLHWAKTPLGAIHWLCVGVLVGGFLQMAVPAGVLIKEGWRPRIDFALSPRVREIALLMVPGFFGTAIYQVNIYVSNLLAYKINDSAATLLFYANRLMELPIGVFAIAVSTVVYPLIARHAVEGKFTAMAEDYRKGVRLILMINVPAAAGLALLSGPIVRLLFQHGQFTAADAHTMTVLLVLFVIGMPFFSVVNLTVRAFYSVKDTATPVKVALIDFTVNLVLSLVLMRWLGAAGLVLASTTAIIVQTLLLKRALTRRLPEMRFGSLWISLGKITLATAGMAAVVAVGWWLMQRMVAGRGADLIAVLVLIPLACAVYGLLLWSLKIEGREELQAMLARVRPGAGGAAP
jgi:putative peptidoglycan lipid II flippase